MGSHSLLQGIFLTQDQTPVSWIEQDSLPSEPLGAQQLTIALQIKDKELDGKMNWAYKEAFTEGKFQMAKEKMIKLKGWEMQIKMIQFSCFAN